MLIRVPRNDAYPAIMLLIFTPAGQFNVKLDNTHRTYEYQLPDGVSEDQVEVYSIYLRNDQLPAPGCGPFLLKALKVPAIETAVDALADAVIGATAAEPLPIAADVPATCPGPDAWLAPAEPEAAGPARRSGHDPTGSEHRAHGRGVSGSRTRRRPGTHRRPD